MHSPPSMLVPVPCLLVPLRRGKGLLVPLGRGKGLCAATNPRVCALCMPPGKALKVQGSQELDLRTQGPVTTRQH